MMPSCGCDIAFSELCLGEGLQGAGDGARKSFIWSIGCKNGEAETATALVLESRVLLGQISVGPIGQGLDVSGPSYDML